MHEIAIFLAAAVIAVPIAKRFRLGAVLGYLAAGIVIGPWGLRLITDVERILELSEFGVVLLLFIIGLELQPSRLWRLRHEVFGLGGAQVLASAALLAVIARALGLGTPAALVAGFGLAMSSTALALQLLAERQELSTRHGRTAFAILLFQDLAIIPFLALVPLLADGGAVALPWAPALQALAVIAGVVLAGRYLLRPVFRVIAATQTPELFTAATLLVVLATALLMESVGLSASLGAFLAGVLLADSEYRHELQADIEPFKGLLLGLFFIAVGMSTNLGLAVQQPFALAALVCGLLLVKGAVLFAIARFVRLPAHNAGSLAAVAAPGGEFAFVLFGIAATAGILDPATQQWLVLAVIVSMLATPPLFALVARLRVPEERPPYDEIHARATPVVIAGFGPFGQIIGRILRVKKIPFTVLEKNWEQVDFVRQFGSQVFYSDAARLEVLKAAQTDKARLFVIAIADPQVSLRIAETVRRHFPQLRVMGCARTRQHALQLIDLGVTDVIRRSFYSSLEATRRVLVALGEPADAAQRAIDTFRRHDEETLLKQQAVHRDEKQLIQTARQSARELEQLFESDEPDSRVR